MSVMILTLNHYKMVYNKACTYRHKKIMDIDYCYTLSSGISYNRLKYLVKDWYKMNVLSYNYRYNRNVTDIEVDSALSAIDSWDYETIKDKPCSPYQMLKTLQCIRYQIEYDSFNEKEKDMYRVSLEILNRAINDIMDAIVSQIPEYKEAKWVIE